MSYARARLWLGISGVGTVVMVSLFLLVAQVPARLLSTTMQFSVSEVVSLTTVLFAYAVLSAPFDFFGGFILPKEYGRTQERLPAFLAKWGRGVLLHSLLLFGIGLALIGATREGGTGLAVAAFFGISLLLLVAQPLVAFALGAGRSLPLPPEMNSLLEKQEGKKPLRVTLIETEATYFTGGIVGLPRKERVILSSQWLERLTPGELRAVLLRKQGVIESGSRLRGLLLALGWNTGGFWLSAVLANGTAGGTASVAGLVTCGLWFTLWSFIGLLLLPTPSQRGVFEGDAYALKNKTDRQTLQSVIEKLDRDQDDEPARPQSIETYFHPLPSVERRLARLESSSAKVKTQSEIGAWHGARMAIYLSWAGFSFLSRAVHCNAGRPDAWVFLPSD